MAGTEAWFIAAERRLRLPSLLAVSVVALLLWVSLASAEQTAPPPLSGKH